MSPNAVLLIEDHPLVSMMLADMLTEYRPDLHVLKVPSIRASETLVQENPHLVIFDLNLPDCEGVASARRVRELYPSSQLLAFTGTTHSDILQELDKMGIPYVQKSSDYHQLQDAVMKGLTTESDVTSLTFRQVEIMRRIAVGMTATEVGQAMGLSAETIRMHISEVLVILGAKNRAHAVSIFIKAEQQPRILEETQSH